MCIYKFRYVEMRLKTQINILKSLKSSQSGSILLSEAYTINSEERKDFNIGTTISIKKLKEMHD